MRAQYTTRRDFTVDNFADQFDITEREEVGLSVFVCSSGGKSLFEFVPPGGGMFLWVCVLSQQSDSVLTRLRDTDEAPPSEPSKDERFPVRGSAQ